MRGTDLRTFSLDSETGELSDEKGRTVARFDLSHEAGRTLAAMVLQYPFIVSSLDELRDWNEWSYLGHDPILSAVLARAKSLTSGEDPTS